MQFGAKPQQHQQGEEKLVCMEFEGRVRQLLVSFFVVLPSFTAMVFPHLPAFLHALCFAQHVFKSVISIDKLVSLGDSSVGSRMVQGRGCASVVVRGGPRDGGVDAFRY